LLDLVRGAPLRGAVLGRGLQRRQREEAAAGRDRVGAPREGDAVRTARIGMAFAVLFLALPVAANAPVAPPSERQYEDFVVGDQRIIDRFTRLSWERNVPSSTTFANAQATVCTGGVPALRVPT